MKLTNLAETCAFDILNFQANAELEIRGMNLHDNVLWALTGIYGGAIGLFGGNTNSIAIRNCLFEGNRAGSVAMRWAAVQSLSARTRPS